MLSATAIAAFVLALVHVLVHRLRFLDVIPRSRWLSLAGGISVAYVFAHIFPELARHQHRFAEQVSGIPGRLEHHLYLVALLGIVAYYSIEVVVRRHTERGRNEAGLETPSPVFWLHMASFAVYNALVGYLLVQGETRTRTNLLLFAFALAMHFIVNDYGLRRHHPRRYRRFGRWILAMAVFAGWGVALATEIHEAAVSTLFAFLAGGIVLNVLKEELPEERRSRIVPFIGGAVLYAALLLMSA